jgi:hemerythrin superfamily protein
MDAITLLRSDHDTAEKLFKRFERLGERAAKSKQDVVGRMIEVLSVHAAIEEQVFYPAVRESVPELEDQILEGLEEHHVVKWTLAELDGLGPNAERFDAKVALLIENVRRHVEEEEERLFPRVREAVGREELQDMGSALEMAKKAAPVRPHPRSPDTPPLNAVTDTLAGVADRVRRVGQETVRKVTP